jgi:hypothetical protein
MLTSIVLVRKSSARSQLSQRGSNPETIENPSRYAAIKNPNNPPDFNNFEIYNRYKSHFFSIRFAILPAVPTARAIQYPVIHTGASNPA